MNYIFALLSLCTVITSLAMDNNPNSVRQSVERSLKKDTTPISKPIDRSIVCVSVQGDTVIVKRNPRLFFAGNDYVYALYNDTQEYKEAERKGTERWHSRQAFIDHYGKEAAQRFNVTPLIKF